MPVSPASRYALLLPSLLLLGCEDPSSIEPTGEEEAELSAACSGAACATLTTPAPLTRGGLAVAGTKLSWVAAGATMGADGRPLDELRQCELPACTTETRLALVTTSGQPIHVERTSLQSAAGGVLFLGYVTGTSAYRLFLSDGQALHAIGPAIAAQRDGYAADASGILVFNRDRRTDGWARSSFTSCTFAGIGPTKPCVSISDKAFNYASNYELTPTRAYVERGGAVVSFDRTTLTDERHEAFESGFVRWSFVAVAENVFSSEVIIRQRGGRVVHDMAVRGSAGSFSVKGVVQATVSDGASLYLGTVGEGDVFGIPRDGLIARYRPGNTRATTLAKEQEVRGVAVDGSKVYWIDATSPSSVEDSFGVVRFVTK